jgi:hypothetical protein
VAWLKGNKHFEVFIAFKFLYMLIDSSIWI